MTELSQILEKEQEAKEKIEAAKEQARVLLEQKKAALSEKMANDILLTEKEKDELVSQKETKIEQIESLYQQKTKQGLAEIKVKKEKNFDQAVEFIIKNF